MDASLAIDTIRKWTKGSIHFVKYSRIPDLPKKLAEHVLEIRTQFSARYGIDYDNIASVKEARENGKPKGGLSGVSEVEEDFLYTGKNGQTLIRLYPVNSGARKKTYVLDGAEVAAEVLLSLGFSKSILGIHDGGTSSATSVVLLDPSKILALD